MKSKILQSFIVASALMLSGSAFAVDSYYGTVTDCQGHSYPIVKIGDQYWMGENLQCTKYDTQSERPGVTLSTSSSATYAPYYTDGRNAITEFCDNLTSTHRKKLGLLYNWAAAVGLATESEAMSIETAFNGKRQGICPNGWHIPTNAEWKALGEAIGRAKAGKKLKSTSGWNEGRNDTDDDSSVALLIRYAYVSTVRHEGGNGTDDYSFAALPAGDASGSTVSNMCYYATFWTADSDFSIDAYSCDLYCGFDDISSAKYVKDVAQSVRCIKNSPVVVSTAAKSSNHKTVTDCQGHTYPVVKIGDQYWMGENLQCTKYDTQSERAGDILPRSLSSIYAPYYTDGRSAYTEDSGDLTFNQRKNLGLLYNWAAAVGLSTESVVKSRVTAFSGRRQGICPNGWHVPTNADWDALGVALGGVKNEDGDFPYVGKKLKTTSGWYDNGNGTDYYFFAALPAGGYSNSMVYVGDFAFFWTATPYNDLSASFRFLHYSKDGLYGHYSKKSIARSVRCVKD